MGLYHLQGSALGMSQLEAVFRTSARSDEAEQAFDRIARGLEVSFEQAVEEALTRSAQSFQPPSPPLGHAGSPGASSRGSLPGAAGPALGALNDMNQAHGFGLASVAPLMGPEVNPRSAPVVSQKPSPGQWRGLVERTATRHDVPAWLVRNVLQVESGGDPGATSPVGAMGLMQLMPGTARELGVTDPYDPAQNLDGGARYLAQMLKRFDGNLEKAVAAYNAGPGAVQRFGGVPPYVETRRYVEKVLGPLKTHV